jgi:hypothetical protein
MKFLTGLIAFIGSIILFLLAVFVPSFAVKMGIDLIFETDVNLAGVFLLMFALIMTHTVFFKKED